MERPRMYSLVGAKTPLTCGCTQTTLSEGRRYTAENGNLSKLGRIYCLGTVFSPRQYLYENGVRGMERPEMYSLVGAKTPLTCGGSQTTLSEGRRYTAENGNLRKLGRIYCLGTVFASRQYLYQKGVRGMESPEMYSFSRCKNPSYLCWPTNYLVSREAVKGRERKPAQIWEDLSPWYRFCTKAIFISKRS